MKNSRPKAPTDLSKEAKQRWAAIQAEYQIIDCVGLEYLATALRHWDRMREAQALIRKEGAVLEDRFGQKKPHPATLIERDSSGAMLRAFRALNFDVEPLRDRPGRPAGR